MTPAVSTRTIRFSTAGSATYRVDLEGPDVGERRGLFAPPYNAATWQAIMLALEPGFVLAEADKMVKAMLQTSGLEDITGLNTPRREYAASDCRS